MNPATTFALPLSQHPQSTARPAGISSPNCLLRMPAVIAKVGIARSTIYKLIAEGKFPPPYRISIRLSVWAVEDVDAWIASIRQADTIK